MAATITAETIVESRPVDRGLTVPLRKAQNVDVVESIRQFLQKPRLLATGSWTPANANNAPLEFFRSFNFGNDPFFVQKLSGFTGIRYTTNVKVVLNATPFQRGKLLLSYYPNARQSGKANMHWLTRVSASQLPSVTMTTMDSAMEVSVPFLSYQEYYDMTGDRRDPVTFRLSVFSPLVNGAAATSVNAGYSVWIWYSDVELFGASTVLPQSGKAVIRKATRTVAADEDRPLSTWLGASSKLASSLSSIPVISSVAGPSAIFLKYASGMAHAFGYSRPLNGEPVRPMAPHYHSAISNADGTNVSSNLAFNHDASCRLITDYSPSGMDEMSINFIKKQWSFIGEFNYSTADAIGAQLMRIGLKPGLTINGSDATETSFFGVSRSATDFLGFLARYYRGSVEICFKFIKTGFHSGTLSFSYQPGAFGNNITLSESNLLHRTVVNIQDGDSVCLSFPFMSSRDWLETAAVYGACYVHVSNQLVAPETVPNSIVVQMYMRGADDMEFSGLANQTRIAPSAEVPLAAPQGVMVEENDEIICEPIGGALVQPVTTGLQMMDSMSESITTLMQFAKMGSRIQFPFNGTTDDVVSFRFNPSAYTVFGRTLPSTNFEPAFYCTTMSMLKACFAFQRGGYELNIIPSTDRATALHTSLVTMVQDIGNTPVVEVDPVPLTLYGSRAASTNTNRFQVVPNQAANHGSYGLSATLPYRSLYRVNAIAPAILVTTTNTVTTAYDDAQQRGRFYVTCRTSDTLLLRGAEDFQLMYWVGVPPFFSF